MASAAGVEHNKELVRKIVEEMFNKGKLDVAPEIFAPDFVDRGHESMAGKTGGPDGFANFVKAVRMALPDLKATIQAMVAEGDHVAMWNTATGGEDRRALEPSRSLLSIILEQRLLTRGRANNDKAGNTQYQLLL